MVSKLFDIFIYCCSFYSMNNSIIIISKYKIVAI